MCSQFICDTLAFLFENTCWKDKGVLFSRSILSSQGKELVCAVIKAGKFQLAECARGRDPGRSSRYSPGVKSS